MKLLIKLLAIGLLLLVLVIPIAALDGLVQERQQRGAEAAEDIARSSSRAQQVIGPLLRVEFERSLRKRRMVGEGADLRSVEEIVRERHQMLVTPSQLDVATRLSTERRRRGLFEAVVYRAEQDIKVAFDPIELPERSAEVTDDRVLGASLVLGLGDARGIRSVQAALDGAALEAQPGSGLNWNPAGFHLPLAPARIDRASQFELRLELIGTQSLHWVPVADDTHVALRGDWPHPSFGGQFLPTRRDIGVSTGDAGRVPGAAAPGDDGFEAEWRISRLAAQAPQALRACGPDASACPAVAESSFGLRLIDPVDRYLKTDRAIKYAWLFIVLVFGAVFFVELLRAVRVHPLQYGLTGLALAMFFLLLLSLSEHIGFGPAYAIASAACVGLVAVYMAAPLGGRGRATGFAALLAGLYGLLYGLLQSEDYALLMGALALFGLLAAAMLLTRRLDWYRVGVDLRVGTR